MVEVELVQLAMFIWDGELLNGCGIVVELGMGVVFKIPFEVRPTAFWWVQSPPLARSNWLQSVKLCCACWMSSYVDCVVRAIIRVVSSMKASMLW